MSEKIGKQLFGELWRCLQKAKKKTKKTQRVEIKLKLEKPALVLEKYGEIAKYLHTLLIFGSSGIAKLQANNAVCFSFYIET